MLFRPGFDMDNWHHLGCSTGGRRVRSEPFTSASSALERDLPRRPGQADRTSPRRPVPPRRARRCRTGCTTPARTWGSLGATEWKAKVPSRRARHCRVAGFRSMSGVPEITVVVATYEWPAALDAVLRALAEQRDPPFQVVVADDVSGEETTGAVARWGRELALATSGSQTRVSEGAATEPCEPGGHGRLPDLPRRRLRASHAVRELDPSGCPAGMVCRKQASPPQRGAYPGRL